MFQMSSKYASNLFLQGDCPILNCAIAQIAMKDLGCILSAIPKHSADQHPIENVLKLKRQAITLNVTSKTFQEFALY